MREEGRPFKRSRRGIRFGAALFAASAAVAGCFPHAKAPRVSVTDVRTWSTPHYARVVIHLSGRAPFGHERLRFPDRVYVDIKGAVLRAARLQPTRSDGGLLKAIRTGQNRPAVVRVVLDLKRFDSYSVFSLIAPERIVVDVLAGAEAPGSGRASAGRDRARLPPPAAPSRSDAKAGRGPRREWSLAERFRRGRGKIVLDPGHGGRDPGAIGVTGYREKDVVLDVAKRLGRILRRRLGARVLLTRARDVYVPLEERTAFANSHGADLFISLHANASPRRRLAGIETYLLREASSRQALEVAARENGVPLERLTDLQIILQDLMMRSKVDESLFLAESVQSSLVGSLSRDYARVSDLGVKRAPFYVLLGAQMPSILVEAGFLSNPVEERRLRSPRYREKLARAVSQGVRRFVEDERLARFADE